jgi:hypothetical protein
VELYFLAWTFLSFKTGEFGLAKILFSDINGGYYPREEKRISASY